MEGEIHLHTKSGWEYTTSLIPSSPFFDFLSSMQEATGDLPSEIELTGSVAEIVEQEWDAYTMMTSGKIVKLQQLSRISLILTMPKEWRRSVAVTRESSQEERLIHIRETKNSSVCYDETLQSDIISRMKTDIIDLDEDAVVPSFELFSSLLLNTRKLKGDWTDVLWEDIPLLLDEFVTSTRLKNIISNTCNLLLGKGSPHAECVTVDITTLEATPERLTYIPQMNVLYDRILASYPENEGLIGMGLEPILNGGKVHLIHNYSNGCRGDNIRLEGLVPWLHFNTLVFFSRDMRWTKSSIRGGLAVERFKSVIELLDVTTVGRNGLLRILDCLERYSKGSKKNKRVDLFIAFTRERIESTPDPIERLPLDTSNEVIAKILRGR